MKINSILVVLLLVFVSCSTQEARRPVSQKTSTIAAETIEQSKKIVALENKVIEAYIKSDSIHNFTASSQGFWYAYITKVDEDIATPKTGEIAVFEYQISDLYDNEIYSKIDLGTKKYHVDKEDLILGLQEGIKLMKIGETITFIIPSYRAFGVTGDDNKIGINQTIKSTVTLININKNNKNNENN